MSKRFRQYIGIFAAIISYYIVHEGAHLLTALYYGVFKRINFMCLGMQIDAYTERMTDTPTGLFCLAGPVATLLFGWVLIMLAKRICNSKPKLFKAVMWYVSLGILIIDPLYMSILCSLFGGGDMNGIKLLLPEIAVRIIFAVLSVIHGVAILKYLLPEYTKSFQMDNTQSEYNMNTNMKQYCLTDRILALAYMYPEFTVGRIISQEKALYRIATSNGEKLAEISGKFRYNTVTISDYPAVGDFVIVDQNASGGNAIIQHIFSRKSCFTRKVAGDARKEQIVAANIDTVFLCMSLNNDYNLRRLERYLSIAWDSGAVPVVVLTKSDLCEGLDEKMSEVSSAALSVDILVTTAVEASGYEQLCSYIGDGKTVAFIGSSGVGKFMLINRLLGEARLDTQGLRNDDKGRHTTTNRELLLLPEGGMVINTPGMRELGMWDSAAGIDQTFGEIEELASRCRFRDCKHGMEPGCAIRKALKDGTLSEERWGSYQKLRAENDYAADSQSYLISKQKKFKEIAKYNKINRKR